MKKLKVTQLFWERILSSNNFKIGILYRFFFKLNQTDKQLEGRKIGFLFRWNILIKLIYTAFNSVLCLKMLMSTLTKRRHNMGNSLGDETSCESSTPLIYSTLNGLAPNGNWVLRKTPLKIYTQVICHYVDSFFSGVVV